MRVRLLTLNLRFGLADDGPNSWTLRKEALKTLLHQHPADVYTFQEANDFQGDFIETLLPDFHGIGRRRPAPDFWQNNLILFSPRWRLTAHDHFYLSPTPDIPSRLPESRWPRQCTVGRLASGSHRLTVATTHLDFSSEAQEAGLMVILDRIGRVPATEPMVLAGDFNSRPGSAGYRLLTGPPHGFKNPFSPPYPDTFHGFGHSRGQGHIDWMLYRGLLETVSCKVVTDTFGGRHPSDHYPVAAAFRFGCSAPRSRRSV